MLLSNFGQWEHVAVNEQPDTGPTPTEIIQVEICYPFSMGKCPCNIAQKAAPCIISLTGYLKATSDLDGHNLII